MALKATVYKVQLTVSDLNRHYYEDHALVLARHPSETDLRLLVRVVAFALNAHERLQFTKGLADVDEPDLWQHALTGEIEHWIDLGQPTEKRLRQSCSKARLVSVYTYQPSAAAVWIETVRDTLARFDRLAVHHMQFKDEKAAVGLLGRSSSLTCVIEDDLVQLTSDAGGTELTVTKQN